MNCPELSEYDSGDIEQIAITHGNNMQDAGICRARHNALVDYLKRKMREDAE